MKGKIGAYSSPGTGHLESSGCGLLREFGQGPFLLIFIKKSLFLPEKSKKSLLFLRFYCLYPPHLHIFGKSSTFAVANGATPVLGAAWSGGSI